MKKRKYHKNLIRLIILIIGIFIFAPCYLNALPLPTGDSTTTINASAIGEPQFKPPVLALENTQLSATEIEEIIDILRDPTASEKIKQNALGKLYRIISDDTVDVALKESIADGLLNIFGDSVLGESLNFKIPSLLKKIALTPDVSPAKQMAIATGLLNALTADNLSFNLKRQVLSSIYSLFSAKDSGTNFLIPADLREQMTQLILSKNSAGDFLVPEKIRDQMADLISAKDNFVISLTIKEQIIGSLFAILKDSNLDNNLENNSLLKGIIISLLKNIALTPKLSPEKQLAITTELLNSLTDDNLNFNSKRQILSSAYSLFFAKDSGSNFLIPAELRERIMQLLLNRDKDGNFLVPEEIRNQMADLISAKDNSVIPLNIGEASVDLLLAAFKKADNDTLKGTIIFLLRKIALTPNASPEKQMAITTGLLNALTDDNFSFNLKRRILGTVYSLLSAKDNAGEFLIPLNIREAAVDLLLAAFNKADLISAAEEDMLLKNMLLKDKIVSLLKRAALTFDISTEKRSQIVTALLSALTSDTLNLDFNVKRRILSVGYSLLSAQDNTGEFLIPLNIREGSVNLLLEAFKKEELVSPVEESATLKGQIKSLLDTKFPESESTLESESALKKAILDLIGNNPDQNALLKSKIVSLLKRVALAPKFSNEKQKNIATELLNSLSSDQLSFSLKRQILDTAYYFLSAKTPEKEFILPVDVRERGVDLLPGILQKPNLVLTVENTQVLKRIIASLRENKDNTSIPGPPAEITKVEVSGAYGLSSSVEMNQDYIRVYLAVATESVPALRLDLKTGNISYVPYGSSNAEIILNPKDNPQEYLQKLQEMISLAKHVLEVELDVPLTAAQKAFIQQVITKLNKVALPQEIKRGLSNKITTDNAALKNKIVAFLKSSVLNFKISAEKQEEVATGLLNALLKNSSGDYNLNFGLKRKILEATHYFIVAKNADKEFIVPVDTKEKIADLLIKAYKKTDPNLDDTPANNDALKGQIASLLKRIVLIPQIVPVTKTKIVNELLDSLINNAFSNTVKKYSVVGALNSLLVNKEKIGEPEEPIVALNLKERIIKWLLEKKILNHQNIVDRVEKDKKDKNGNVIKDKNGNVIKEIEYEVREPLVNLFKSAVLISNLDVGTKESVVTYLITSMDGRLPDELSEKVLVALKNIGTGKNVDTDKIRRPILDKFLEFLEFYKDRDPILYKRELIASYVAAIGRADADLKDVIAAPAPAGLGLNERQKKIWNKFNILTLNLTRDFLPEELNHIFNVLDALSPKEIDGIIDTVSLFFAINYGGGTAGWNEDNASIGILNGAYNPSNVNGFLKSLCSEIAKAVHPTLTSSSRAKFSDINEFSTLFKEYITNSEALINQAKADAGNAKLLTQVKIIIRIFDYTMEDDATKKVYTFKIENDQINQQEVTLGDDGLPVFSPGA